MVQFGALALLDPGVAGEHRGFQDLLSDELADHRIRHPFFLGGADDHDGNSLYGKSALPRGLSALAGTYGERGENVQVQRDGTRSGGTESAVRNRRSEERRVGKECRARKS